MKRPEMTAAPKPERPALRSSAEAVPRRAPPSAPPAPRESRPAGGRRWFCTALVVGCVQCLAPSAAEAAPLVGKPKGRPRVKLDRLELPRGLADVELYTRHLKHKLQRAARRADWGASSRSTISYRFRVETLTLAARVGVLTVHCEAVGELPRRRTARTKLSYSGDPAEPQNLVLKVLEIVASGVISRLSDLERTRRLS